MKPTMQMDRKTRLAAFAFFGTAILFAVVNVGLAYLLNMGSRSASAGTGYVSWPAFDGGYDDPGSNYSESALNTGNVSGLRVLWQASLPAAADDAVVEAADVSTPSGVMNLVFVNTIKGNLIAYNALTGAKIWEADPSEADYNGQGTKSTPAIDPSGAYIYAYAVDGYIHKYNIATGAEAFGEGFPAQATLMPNNIEKGSASINIGGGYLYMTLSGNDGDYGHYEGHIVAVNLSTGVKTVWNAECDNITTLLFTSGANYCASTQAGMWARPGVKIDPATGNVFAVTGNGNYNANSGGNNFGDSLVELSPNLSTMIDSYTPATYASLDSGDADLGSTAPAILPKQTNSNTPYMLVQAGKDHIIRLLNRTNLSGQGGPRHTGGEMQQITISNEVHEQPAVWVDPSGYTWVFVTDESGDLYAYKVITTSGNTQLAQVYSENIGVSSSPFVANGVLYFSGNNILAYNATTGARLFDSSSIGVSLNMHWESPVVVNGMLFTPDNNGKLDALYVPGVTPTTPPTLAPTPQGSGGSGGGGGGTSKSQTPAQTAKTPTPSPKASATPSATPHASSSPVASSSSTGLKAAATVPSPGTAKPTAGLSSLTIAATAGSSVIVIVIVLAAIKVYAVAHAATAAAAVAGQTLSPWEAAARYIGSLLGRGGP